MLVPIFWIGPVSLSNYTNYGNFFIVIEDILPSLLSLPSGDLPLIKFKNTSHLSLEI